MRFWQTEWHGIRFDEFARTSSREPAGDAFYEAFYAALFDRVDGYSALDPEWRRKKDRVAEFIRDWAGDARSVLSVGCGLGYVEHRLLQSLPAGAKLFAQETGETALRWLAREMPPERLRVGPLPDCLPAGERFDLVYLSAVDYALPHSDVVALLRNLAPFLRDPGELLMISASYRETRLGWRDPLRFLRRSGAALLDALGLRSRGQFWGWLRSRDEYLGLMADAGYAVTGEGFLDPQRKHYWIAGRCRPASVRG